MSLVRKKMEEPPTEEGWYYARFRNQPIMPRRLDAAGYVGGTSMHKKEFDWFGPVETCVEG